MSTVRVFGGDSGDFVSGKLLVWSALNALRPCKECPCDEVDLTELHHARPYTAAAIAALGVLADGRARLSLPSTQDARDFVVRSGLLNYFVCDEASHLSQSPRNVPVQHLARVDSTFADRISRAWEAEFGGLPAGLRPILAGHLDEIMLNALSHAESAIGCIVAAQVYPTLRCVELAILDLGQTIRGHLTKNPLHKSIGDDAQAILRATEEGVSGTPEGQVNRLGDPNSGVGLYELRHYCECGGGEMTIVSGAAMVTFGRSAHPVTGEFAGGFPDCLVSVRFRVDGA
ncbi:MAG: hypothetical protein DYG94_07395 [Leptolyngbya sp. PLA3]|nr:MAG: hypothetical protein EDM82_06590 [Cyanobacteria bacterium CYA]MCE7968554.1 hypothetical protein [Leptolyngbya sp. PL-A3]